MKTALAALLLCSAYAQASSLLGEIRQLVDKRIELGTGDTTLQATVLEVGDDHFCVRVHIPDFEHRRCYAAAAVSFTSDGGGTRPPGVWVFEPKRR